ncbi:MAG: hypothetical protein IPL59_16990 [Candidatus Competibacteraceae bacterium]|uniref:Uncharacterized protein n=1 Tax=Candidatus Contendobacter odensis Run_B_J11 TaxID=1400861 RepID=A0A7U7GE69_9GAMM|nr:hypothetical protein [Candidatus Contendobacter odensis]MBK8536666.1 hypothetical protein [Candidatus Competibacteraceae bacterium]MBK8752209.1 hypothetical protein [Candidatus Competibacteraceae bacterium]CDH46736.1 hypothetical protein BN874_590004 [Candidatus Contendobacter odensis Run_B_J11]
MDNRPDHSVDAGLAKDEPLAGSDGLATIAIAFSNNAPSLVGQDTHRSRLAREPAIPSFGYQAMNPPLVILTAAILMLPTSCSSAPSQASSATRPVNRLLDDAL